MTNVRERIAEEYARFYEDMTPDSLARLPELAAPDIHFVDPFNDIHGVDAMGRMFKRMFADLAEPRFRITHRAWAGEILFLRWQFTARSESIRWIIEGMSEIAFAPDGRVSRHIDHWDAGKQFYERLPLLGRLLRFIRRRLSA